MKPGSFVLWLAIPAAVVSTAWAQQSATASKSSDVCLSNACSEPQASVPPTTHNPRLAAAVKAGDVNRIMELGGSPIDVIDAMRSRLATDSNALLDPNAPHPVALSFWMFSTDEKLARGDKPVFIQSNGRTLMAAFDPAGNLRWSTVVPGMNAPGRKPVGMPYTIAAPPPPSALPAPPPG